MAFWSNLRPSVHPVLFVSPWILSSTNQNCQYICQACDLGFSVFVSRENVNDTYPVLGYMFEKMYSIFTSATWFGYSDIREIFDLSLPKVLRFVENSVPEIFKNQNFVVGRSNLFEVSFN